MKPRFSRLSRSILAALLSLACSGCWSKSSEPGQGVGVRVGDQYVATALHVLDGWQNGEDLWVSFPARTQDMKETGPRGELVGGIYRNTFFTPFSIDMNEDGWEHMPEALPRRVNVNPFQKVPLDALSRTDASKVYRAPIFAAKMVRGGRIYQLHLIVSAGGTDPARAAKAWHDLNTQQATNTRGVITVDDKYLGAVEIEGRTYYKSLFILLGAYTRQTQVVYATYDRGFTLEFMVAFPEADGGAANSADAIMANAVRIGGNDVITDIRHYVKGNPFQGTLSPNSPCYAATVVATDPEHDLALLKIKPLRSAAPSPRLIIPTLASRELSPDSLGTLVGHFAPYTSADGQTWGGQILWDDRAIRFGNLQAASQPGHLPPPQTDMRRHQGTAKSRDMLSPTYASMVDSVALIFYNTPKKRNQTRVKIAGQLFRDIHPGMIPGFSGSPVFDSDSRLAGIYSHGTFPVTGDAVGHVAPVSALRKLLDGQGVPTR